MSKKTILIVDDELRGRNVLRNILKTKGFEVDLAGTFGEGKRKTGERKYDCILLDCLLPDTKPPEGETDEIGLGTIRRIFELGDAPVVIYTGVENPRLLSEARENGAVNVAVKGSGWEVILEKINLAIAWNNPDSATRTESAQQVLEAHRESYRPVSRHPVLAWFTTHRIMVGILAAGVLHLVSAELFIYRKGSEDAIFKQKMDKAAEDAARATKVLSDDVKPRLDHLENESRSAREERMQINKRVDGFGNDISALRGDVNNGFTRTQEQIAGVYKLLIERRP